MESPDRPPQEEPRYTVRAARRFGWLVVDATDGRIIATIGDEAWVQATAWHLNALDQALR